MVTRRILQYNGYGTTPKPSQILHGWLTEKFAEDYSVELTSGSELLKALSGDGVELVVFGSGFDVGMLREIGVDGCRIIQNYVKRGGKYLGICAGAYFACENIEFDVGSSQEVIGERYIKLHKDIAIGPLVPYTYSSEAGAVAMEMKFVQSMSNVLTSKRIHLYYNGGPQFPMRNVEAWKCVEKIAYFAHETPDCTPAIIYGKYGEGSVVLSGVHFEYGFSDVERMWKNSKAHEEHLEKLKNAEFNRQILSNFILNNLLELQSQ